jgi:hypothetical protein
MYVQVESEHFYIYGFLSGAMFALLLEKFLLIVRKHWLLY